jgi:hypothetical protein
MQSNPTLAFFAYAAISILAPHLADARQIGFPVPDRSSPVCNTPPAEIALLTNWLPSWNLALERAPYHEQHIIRLPNLVPPRPIDFNHASANNHSGGWSKNHGACVVRILHSLQDDTVPNGIVGDGILITPTLVLTLRPLAEMVSSQPDGYTMTLILGDRPPNSAGEPYVHLKYCGAHISSRKLDILSTIEVEPIPDCELLLIDQTPLPLKEPVFMIGSHAGGEELRCFQGSTTTRPSLRNVSNVETMLQGTNLHSYCGLSGSPVFARQTGKLVGLYLRGAEEALLSGENTTWPSPPRDGEWEKYPYWTWIVPISMATENLRNLSIEATTPERK